jgi:CHAD domain-containing protein
MAGQKENFVGPLQSVGEAFEQILRANLVATREWEPVVLAGEDPEGIHQMRVCLRRMRSALAVFRPAIPRKVTRSFLEEMRCAAKTFDRPRDLDVYIAENLSSECDEQMAKLRRLAMKHRDMAYSEATEFIQGKRYAKLCDGFRQWVETQGWRVHLSTGKGQVLDANVIPFASEVLEQERTRVLDNGKDIESLDSAALHQLRIDCKKLRYAAEFFAPLYGDPMKEFVIHLKSLQDLLGMLHDTAVMPELQKDLLKGSKSRSLRRYARRLVSQRVKQAKATSKALKDSWGDFCSAKRPWRDAAADLP